MAAGELNSTLSTVLFETTDIDEIKLVLFAAPLRAHSGIIEPLLVERPATDERLADDLERIKAMGSLVHLNYLSSKFQERKTATGDRLRMTSKRSWQARRA